MSKCDHKNTTTPYCPQCGKPATREGVHGELLAYCNEQLRKAVKSHEQAKEMVASEYYKGWSSSTQTTWRRRVPKTAIIVEKWARWCQWMIEEPQHTQPRSPA